MNFSTEKDFAWMDQWNLSEAPDRRVRRCGVLLKQGPLPHTFPG